MTIRADSPEMWAGTHDGAARLPEAVRRPRAASAWPLALVLVAAPAHALEMGWLLGGGLEYSDNIGRDADGEEEDEWIRDLRAGLVLQEETSRYRLDFDGMMRLQDYADNTFTEGVLFEGNGSVEADLIPHRVTWVALDSFRQVPEVTRSAPTPGNEQNANAFVTGPDVELPLGGATFARASARYGDYYFEETDEDHVREVGQIGLARRISSVSELSVNARSEEVMFDDEEIVVDTDDPDDEVFREDFVTDSAFVRYDRELANDGRVTLDVGGYEVERDQLDDADGPMARLDARRGLGASAAAGFRVGRGPTDIGQRLAGADRDPLGADIGSATITGDVGEERSARAFYSHRFGRLAFTLSGGATEEDYSVDEAQDREIGFVALGLDYRMTPRRTLFAEVDRSRTEYDRHIDVGAEDSERDYNDYDDYGFTLGFDQRLGRAITLTGAVSQDRRDAHAGGVDYTENRARVTLVYGFGHPDVVGEAELFDEDV